MLINLHVKNLALIKEVDVDFSNGLIVLTGETGAGKSLLLGSVNIALGNKVSKDIIRNGEDFALVELTFLTKKEQADFIRNMDIFVDDDNIITVSRKITESRSVSKINGETVNVKTLKTIMEMLIDIHGQHDHQSLLYPAKHLEILDKFAKDKIEDKLADLKELNNNYKKLKQKLDEYSMDEAQRAREIEFAKFEVDEIEQADLKENEDVAVYDTEVTEKIENKLKSSAVSQERDEYFEAAARFVIEKDKASIGMLQRMFKIGFNRAARIVDQLSDAGIVGPEEGTKPRKVLMSSEQLESYFEEYL